MNDRYVMANIKMPIKVNADGTTDPLAEYMSFELEECDKPDANLKPRNVQSEFIENINRLFNIHQNEQNSSVIEPLKNIEKEPPIALTITKDEINRHPKKSAAHNTSFKNIHNARSRHTIKNYSNS